MSSIAPWAIQRVISSISAADSGGLSWGISALPSLSGVICSTRWLSAGLPGTIAAIVALAPLEHPVERRHHVAAPRLGRLVAALALSLEDRADLLVVADFDRGTRPGLVLLGLVRRDKHRGSDQQGQQRPQASDTDSPRSFPSQSSPLILRGARSSIAQGLQMSSPHVVSCLCRARYAMFWRDPLAGRRYQ